MKIEQSSIHEAIVRQIRRMAPEACFSRSDFAALGSREAISQVLSRLERAGLLISPLRGYYCRRRTSRLLKVDLPADYAAVAEAIARNAGWTIIPCGDIAANELGLSTQVPAVWSYVSTGPYRSYAVGKTRLEFKHTANRELFNMSRKSAMVVQALKALGRDHVTDETVRRLANVLTRREIGTLLRETAHVTSWIYDVIKMLGKEEAHA